MKANESIYNKERQQKILEKIKSEHRVSVKELTEEFNVSGVSIRNDLNILSETGEIIRTHGGAIYVEAFRGKGAGDAKPVAEDDLLTRLLALAMETVKNGDIVFMDGNFPTETIQAAIPEKISLTIITNRMDTAQVLAELPQLRVVLTGGIVEGNRVVGQQEPTLDLLQGYNVGKAILYPVGFSTGVGLTESDPVEIGLKRLIVENAVETTAILTPDRMGTVSLGTYLTATKLTRLIISGGSNGSLSDLMDLGIEIVSDDEGFVHSDRKDTAIHSVYEQFRRTAGSGSPYYGSPGVGKRIGFANGYSEGAYCRSVEESIKEQALLAGFSEDDIIVRDNRHDEVIALKNADAIIRKKPDVFIEFQIDSVTNNIIATKFRDKDIPIMAVDIPIPGAIYMGVDNWESGVLAGKEAVRLVRERWGSWDAVDLAVVFQMDRAGEVTMLRSEGFIDELVSAFGEEAEDKIVRPDIGIGTRTDAESAVDQLISKFPSVNRVLVTSTTERGMRQVIETLRRRGLLDSIEWIAISHGCDSNTVEYIRNNEISLAIGHFPERYGEYIVPAACAMMMGHSVPPHIFVQNTIITRENIDDYYPAK